MNDKLANEEQVGGTHYQSDYQHWDMSYDLHQNVFEQHISRYVTRAWKKDGLKDVKKAIHAVKKLQEVQEERRRLLLAYFEANNLDEKQRIILKALEEKKYDIVANWMELLRQDVEDSSKCGPTTAYIDQ